jgi:hypothetical protein
MHEILMRSRWFIVAFIALTVISIATYLSETSGEAVAGNSAAGGPPVEVTAEADADGGASATHSGSPDDGLIDKTVGEDVRPEEEKQAEAAASAAAAAQLKLPPPAEGEDQAE